MGVVSYESALRSNSGRTIGNDVWLEGQSRQARLATQTEHVASVLEAAGIQVRMPTDVSLVGDVTGCSDLAQSWRAIRILPAVAQRDRRPVLNGLRLWLRQAGGRYVRYAVVTSGERVPVGGDLKKRQREHTANLRRWSSEASTRYGVEVLLRSTEYTVNDGGVHLHSNIVYRPLRRLQPAVWAEFLSWSRGRLRAHWRDCGRLKDAAEVVKYCLKPGDLTALDGDLPWLYEQTYRAKLVQPLGAFASWLDGLERDRLKVASVWCGERSILRLVRKAEREPTAGRSDDLAENVLLGRTLPQARWCPWAEPVSLVAGYTEQPTTAQGVRRLAELRRRQVEARGWWDANGGPDPAPYSVHTHRPTVQAVLTGTEVDGAVYDLATGEVLYEPPPDADEARRRVRTAVRQAYELVTAETVARLAAWHAGAPERAAWERTVAVERELQSARLVA